MNPIGFETLAVVKICILFGKTVWLNKTRILCLSEKNARSYKNCEVLQLHTNIHSFKYAALNDKTHSTYLVGIS